MEEMNIARSWGQKIDDQHTEDTGAYEAPCRGSYPFARRTTGDDDEYQQKRAEPAYYGGGGGAYLGSYPFARRTTGDDDEYQQKHDKQRQTYYGAYGLPTQGLYRAGNYQAAPADRGYYPFSSTDVKSRQTRDKLRPAYNGYGLGYYPFSSTDVESRQTRDKQRQAYYGYGLGYYGGYPYEETAANGGGVVGGGYHGWPPTQGSFEYLQMRDEQRQAYLQHVYRHDKTANSIGKPMNQGEFYDPAVGSNLGRAGSTTLPWEAT